MVKPLPSFSLGENVRIINLPEGDSLNGATGTFVGIGDNEGYIGIVLLDKPTETHIAINMPVVCLDHDGPKSFATPDLVDEAMYVQGLRSDRKPSPQDRHWMEQSIESVLLKRIAGMNRDLFPNAPGLDDMLRQSAKETK